ncbi:hypothetical protein QE152_g5500 [Popillia japonica]|uniref:Uncharacterized protein n=1 Tax=Popillia japonica TaxID=7064 RepID=A0AAW1MLS2_POPJA
MAKLNQIHSTTITNPLAIGQVLKDAWAKPVSEKIWAIGCGHPITNPLAIGQLLVRISFPHVTVLADRRGSQSLSQKKPKEIMEQMLMSKINDSRRYECGPLQLLSIVRTNADFIPITLMSKIVLMSKINDSRRYECGPLQLLSIVRTNADFIPITLMSKIVEQVWPAI